MVAYRSETHWADSFGPLEKVYDTPAGAEEGDILIFQMWLTDTYATNQPEGAITLPGAGYTRVIETASDSHGMIIWIKEVGASEPATHTFTLTSRFIQSGICLCVTAGSLGEATVNNGLGSIWTATGLDVVNSDALLTTFAHAPDVTAADRQTQRVNADGTYAGTDTPGVGPSGVRSGSNTFQNWWAINVCIEGTAGGEPVDPPDWPPQLLQWTNISMPEFSSDYFTSGMGFCRDFPNVLYCCTGSLVADQPFSGVWKSMDFGMTWSQTSGVSGQGPGQPVGLAIDPENPNRAYVCDGVRGSKMGFWRTTDGGLNWEQPPGFDAVSPSMDMYGVVTSPLDFDNILVSYHGPWEGNASGLAHSLDGGDTWALIDPPPPVVTDGGGVTTAFLHFPELSQGNDLTWIFGTQAQGWFKTEDGGDNWVQCTTIDMSHGDSQFYYAPDGTLFFACAESIMMSTDNGDSFTTIGPGTDYILAIAGDGKFIYTLKKLGNSPVRKAELIDPDLWTNVGSKIFPAFPGVGGGATNMAFDPTTRRLYCAASENGLWVYQFEVDPNSAMFFNSGF